MARRDLLGAVDFARLTTYAGGDPALVEEVLALFEEQAAIWLRLLEGAAAGAGFRDAAHTVKGAALGLCADALAGACDRAEAEGEAATPALREVLAGHVHDEVDRVLADIAAWRHERLLQSLHRPRAATT
jgi:HPt (histidine-containing phosphotransfer) domain-containing protein